MKVFSVFTFAFSLLVSTASAQTYPTKSIRLVVGFPPGGGIDFIARAI